MLKASEMEQHVLLEEMGFPALLDDKGKVKNDGLHPFFAFPDIFSCKLFQLSCLSNRSF